MLFRPEEVHACSEKRRPASRGAEPIVEVADDPGWVDPDDTTVAHFDRDRSPQSRHGASMRTVSPGNSQVTEVATKPHCANHFCSPPTLTRYWVGRLLSGGNDAM